MINPHLFEPSTQKVKDPRLPGGKVYFPFMCRRMRRPFKTKQRAYVYAFRIHVRWCRLYNAAITAMVESAR